MWNFLYTIFIFPIYEIISFLFVIFYKITENYGLSAIGLSFAVTILCLPLYVVAEKWQEIERNKVREMAPMVKTIKEVFQGDEQFMILSTYYRQNHYKPLYALRSSFGLLIQIPFFMAAYSFLSNLTALSGKSFLFIHDLSQSDSLFSVFGFGINVLPILMTVINIVAGAIYTKGFSLREKLQIYVMALIFLVLLYDSPSALVLYWTMNNVLSLVKNIFYKLKKPLRALYILCFVLLVPVTVYTFMVLPNQNRKLKILLLAVTACVGLLPVEIKVCKAFFSFFIERVSCNVKSCSKIFFSSAIALWVLVGILVPLNLVASSPRDFSFLEPYSSPLSFVWITGVQAFGFIIVWSTMLYFLFSNKTKALFAYIFNVALWICLLNVFVFRSKLGNVSIWLEFSDLQGFRQSSLSVVTTVASYVLIFALIAFAFKFFDKTFAKVFSKVFSKVFVGKALYLVTVLAFLSMVAMCLLRGFFVQKEYKGIVKEKESSTGENTNTNETLIELSTTGKNVIVVMVDRGLTGFIPAIFEEIEGLSSQYDGFVYYSNAVSFAGSTIFGNPCLAGGYEYTPIEMNKRENETLVDKNNESLKVLPRLFSENGYSVFVSDSAWSDYFWEFIPEIYDEIENVRAVSLEKMNDHCSEEYGFESTPASYILEKNLLRYSLLQVSPPVMRKALYDEAFYRNRLVIDSLTSSLVDYAVLDNLPEYTSFITANDSSAINGTYTSITSNLVHNPFFLQAPDYVPVETVTNYGTSPYAKSSQYHVMAAALKLLGKWFDTLKENGAYDNTRIILVSDHGRNLYSNYDGNVELPNGQSVETYQCLLMVKDFDAHGDLVEDTTFMTNADVPTLATQNLIENAANPYSGKVFSMEGKENGIFVTTSDAWDPVDHGKYVFNIKKNEWLFVHDNIHDSENWTVAVPDFY